MENTNWAIKTRSATPPFIEATENARNVCVMGIDCASVSTIIRLEIEIASTGTAYPSGTPGFTLGFFSGVRVTRSLVSVVDSCLSFSPFSFGHCVFCPSSLYGF